jgi:excisionase family DNA binding protein
MQTTRIVRLTIIADFTRQETYDFADPISLPNTLGKNEYLLTPEQLKSCRYSMKRLQPIISPAGVLKVREPLNAGNVLLIAIPRGRRLADIVIDPSTALDFMLDPRDKRRKSSDTLSSDSEDPDMHRALPGLLYLFAIGKDGIFDVTAKVINDEDDFYTKLKANLDDVPMREYLVQRSLADSKVTLDYVTRVPDRMDHIQAAEYLGVKQKTLYTMVEDGRIPVLKAGRKNQYLKADLDAYLNRST